MKLSANTAVTTLLSFVVLAGCQESVKDSPDEHLVNSHLVDSYNETAIRNAIIAQHTLFAYHFVQNGPELNELGERDLAVLVRHFSKNSGRLNIRRHNIPAELYGARVNSVREGLEEAGIDMERLSVSDGMPGGSGMASERILVILEDEGGTAGSAMTLTSGARQ
ncbi:MAG: hypothetical protein JSW66_16620 [Phycisphaerales bacterium]|nr:MAG: hypothetical protein JSW66_16620 [Phycisphaerales bacterium]